MTSGGAQALLHLHGLRAKRQFGQNFLTDRELCSRIAAAATGPVPAGCVLEIGAGLGALTRPLLERSALVVAVEKDRELLPVLAEEFSTAVAAGKLKLWEADARELDLAAFFAAESRPRVLAGNLPYLITGPILRRVVELGQLIERAAFMLQLEVAERLVAMPGGKAYGALSVFVQAQYEVSRAFVVRRGAFYPVPGVDSAVVVLLPRASPIIEHSPRFERVVQAAFQQRRKKLRNAWRGLFPEAEDLGQAARKADIDLELRGEVLEVAQFAQMARQIAE